MYLVIGTAIIICFLFKVLNVTSIPVKAQLYTGNRGFLQFILKNCNSLKAPYCPTRLWGYSGHVQTIIQGLIGRFHIPLISGKRYYLKHMDKGTITYDLYFPSASHSNLEGDFTLAICPGLCNSSESAYIRRIVQIALLNGYRVSVLNHVGVLKGVPVTSSRIFSYGNTSDYDRMIDHLLQHFPSTRIICIGFSMGGNIITKYLGEKTVKSNRIISGISVCQGYDACLASKLLLNWSGGKRLYLLLMTENIKAILRRWQKVLFTEALKSEKNIVEKDVWYASTLIELDESYTRRVHNFETLEEFYKYSSSIHYLDGIVVPMIFINAKDDPIVPPQLLQAIKTEALRNDKFIYIEQEYGGHLGFYEGGLLIPNVTSWLDRVLIDLANSLSLNANKVIVSNEFSSDNDESTSDEDYSSSLTLKKENGYWPRLTQFVTWDLTP